MKCFHYLLSLLIILCSVLSGYAQDSQEPTKKIKTKSILVEFGGNYWHQKREIPFRSIYRFPGYIKTSKPGFQVGLLWNFKLGEHINFRTGGALFLEHTTYETDVETQINNGHYWGYMPLETSLYQFTWEIPIMLETNFSNWFFITGLKKHISNVKYIVTTDVSGNTWKDWSKARMYPLLAVSPSLRVEYQFDKIKNIRAYTGVDYRYFGRKPLEPFYQFGFCIPVLKK